MDKSYKTKEKDKISGILTESRFSPKFDEMTEDYQDDRKEGRPKGYTLVFLNGLLALFSNPLLH